MSATGPSAEQSVISVRDVTIKFGTFTAVDGVSLSVQRGALFRLLGPNGSGKMTLIRALCGLLPLAGGTPTDLGHDMASESLRHLLTVGYSSHKFSPVAKLDK